MRIIVDVFGGDLAPAAPLEGALLALERDREIQIVLAGDQPRIEALLQGHSFDASRVEILHAPDTVGYDESPTVAIRRYKDSSLVKGLTLLRDGGADAFVSAGNTGALLAGATLLVRRLDGVKRPALASLLPTAKGKPVLLLDCGANADCKPVYLQQFALMGDAYLKTVCGVQKPNVALLNNGTEVGKGNELTKEAYALLEQLDLCFVGNQEARELLQGDVDVFVCDGFVGNAVLKSTEGAVKILMQMMKKELTASLFSSLGAAMAKPAFKRLKKQMDYTEYGGAPLLGIRRCVIKAHGTSNANSIATAVLQARDFVAADANSAIAARIAAVAGTQD